MDNKPKAPKGIVWWTKIITVVALVIVLGWDFIVAHNPFSGDTVSEITMQLNLKYLFLPAVLGYITGHLVWPGEKKRGIPFAIISMVILLGFALGLDVLLYTKIIHGQVFNFLRDHPPLVFLPYLILGHFFWPQIRTKDTV